MDIFACPPSNWVDLQNKVAYILRFSGYRVETPKKVTTVRGNVEFDVFALSRDISIACECKYWSSRVPQSVVYTFRSQLEDAGINKGYIITMKGFQSGSYESAENTIICLKTWDEFLLEFREPYLREQIGLLSKIRRPIFRVVYDKPEYWAIYEKLATKSKIDIDKLKNRLLNMFFILSSLCDTIHYEHLNENRWDTNVDNIINYFMKIHEKDFQCYFEFFEWLSKQITITTNRIEDIYEIKII